MKGNSVETTMNLDQLETPCLVLDERKLSDNVNAMRSHLNDHGTVLRPHMKTAKNIDIARMATVEQNSGIAVSTLAEADYFLENGIRDILYAVGIAPTKLAHAANLINRGAKLKLLLDNIDLAKIVGDRAQALSVTFPILLEIDCDGHRSGIKPDDPTTIEIAEFLVNHDHLEFLGVLTHAGGAYACGTPDCVRHSANQEIEAINRCAAHLRRAGIACEIVSAGSTPTCALGSDFSGVTEMRAGVFVFNDLMMVNLGVCDIEDIALSVLSTIIGHRKDKNWIITDSGWMALSGDRGTRSQVVDYGFGLVSKSLNDDNSRDLLVIDVNQEHGILAYRDRRQIDFREFPIGKQLRILPNHACATAAAHASYNVISGGHTVKSVWHRC